MDSLWLEVANVAAKIRSNSENEVHLRRYRAAPDATNEAVFFLKPELCSDPIVRLSEVSNFIGQIFESYNLQIMACSAFSGSYLAKSDIMVSHYGTINRVSKMGLSALSADALTFLQSKFDTDLRLGAKVLGGHQVLAKYPYFSEESLSVLWDTKNLESVRIAPGAYVLPFQALSERWSSDRLLILNGFHPFQLKFFTGSGRCIICFVVRSTTPWKVLREKVVGSTNPREADATSIRRTLLEKKDDWNIIEVNKGLNGVHLSAGPIEAYFEIERFFSSTAKSGSLEMENTNFGALCQSHGVSDAKLFKCRGNPVVVVNGKSQSLFDATEDMELAGAAKLLSTLSV